MMDQTVALLAAVVALFGTAIGLRFNVYILIPAGLAVLILSVVAQLTSNKMAGWGVQGAAECRFCSWVIFARGSSLLVREADCATIRGSG